MPYMDTLFENELGNQVSISVGSVLQEGERRILMEISGPKSHSTNILTPKEFDELIKLGQTYQKKLEKAER